MLISFILKGIFERPQFFFLKKFNYKIQVKQKHNNHIYLFIFES